MNITKILEFQSVDMELFALENEAMRERLTFMKVKSEVDKAGDTIKKLSTESADLLANFKKIEAKIVELKKKLDEIEPLIANIADINEADYYLKQTTSILDQITALEKESKVEETKIATISANYQKTWELGLQLTESLKRAKIDYEKIIASMQPQVIAIKKKLDTLKGEVPDDLMKIYEQQRKAKKLPAFVAHEASKENCSKCRMELSGADRSLLRNSGDFSECPNCGSVLIVV